MPGLVELAKLGVVSRHLKLASEFLQSVAVLRLGELSNEHLSGLREDVHGLSHVVTDDLDSLVLSRGCLHASVLRKEIEPLLDDGVAPEQLAQLWAEVVHDSRFVTLRPEILKELLVQVT